MFNPSIINTIILIILSAYEINTVWLGSCPERDAEIKTVINDVANGDELAFIMLKKYANLTLSHFRPPPTNYKNTWTIIDGVPLIYRQLAIFVGTFEKNAFNAKNTIIQIGKKAYEQYQEDDDPQSLLSPLISSSFRYELFKTDGDFVNALFQQIPCQSAKRYYIFRVFLHVMWDHLVEPEWELLREKLGQNNIPAISAHAYDGIEKSFGIKKYTIDKSDDKYSYYNKTGNLQFEIPTIDSKIFDDVLKGVSKLSSIGSIRLLSWLIKRGFFQNIVYKNPTDKNKIIIEGGYSALAQEIGLSPKSGGTTCRRLLLVFAHGQFHFSNGKTGNLIELSEPVMAAPRQKARIVIQLNSVLMPGHVHSLPKSFKDKRHLIPLFPEPPYIGRNNEHNLQWQLFMKIIIKFVNSSRAFLNDKFIILSQDTLLEFSTQLGLKSAFIEKVMTRWTQEDGPFVRIGEFGLRISEKFNKEIEFIKDLARKAIKKKNKYSAKNLS